MAGMGLDIAIRTHLPRYRSHKEVQAAEIVSVTSGDNESKLLELRLAADKPTIRQLFVASDLKNRPEPHQGDYLLLYEDGYVSFSPREPFLNGYDPLE